MHYLFSHEKEFGINMAKRLLSRGSDVNYTSPTSSFGQSLLVQAVRLQKHEIIEFLLRQGANPHIMDLSGSDACDYAKKLGFASKYNCFSGCDPKAKK